MYKADARLNQLAAINQARRYLEIGVSAGHSFQKVAVEYREGVDPKFRFDFKAAINEKTKLNQTFSDSYWYKTVGEDAFDLIYLDGLHTFEQTLRDFTASLGRAHQRTIWLIDDVWPASALASISDYAEFETARAVLKGPHSWMGDVFKVIPAIALLFPQLRYATFSDHPQTVVWHGQRQREEPPCASLQQIMAMTYFDFIVRAPELLNVKDPQVLVDTLQIDLDTTD